MKKIAKRVSKPATKGKAKTVVGRLGKALASTAAYAAGVARETEGVVRDFASNMTGQPPDETPRRATDLLVAQHRRLEQLFERLESPQKGGFDATLRELADELSAHITIEETLFYPAVRKLKPDLILEGLEEHAMGRFALQRLLGTKASDKSMRARLKALKELMTNHHHEEEHDLFTVVRRHMPNPRLERLGAAMKKTFDAGVQRGHEAVLAAFHDQLHRPVRAKSPQRAKPKTSRPVKARV